MQFGIRRKLVGTLILVGLLPMILSLMTILGLGARDHIDTIQDSYIDLATACANAVSFQFEAEANRLKLTASLPEVISFIQQHNDIREVSSAPSTAPATTAPGTTLNNGTLWTLHEVLNNPIANRMRLISADKTGLYHVMVVNRHGLIIAADARPAILDVRKLWWWKIADSGIGGTCVIGSTSSELTTSHPIASIIIPVVNPGSGVLVGFMVETLNMAALTYEINMYLPQVLTVAQIYDQKTKIPVFIIGNRDEAKIGRQCFISQRGGYRPGWIGDIDTGCLIGAAPVQFSRLSQIIAQPVVMPHWSVILSQPTRDILLPILHQARLVGFAGGFMILGIFAFGYIISKREIIYPILRLREATSAVGRGELNIRLLSQPETESAFRRDELGDLARDFDDMTRRLAANVRQLEQGGKAKQRFMDLAAHELRSPISHVMTTAQLMLRQLANASLARPGPDAPPDAPAKEIYKSVDSILKNSRRLSKIVTDLLKLVQEDVFTTRPRRDPFDLKQVILDVCDQQSGFIHARQQKLEVTLPDTIPTMLGDPDKIGDILTNLLSNAIRFSPDAAVIRVIANVLVGEQVELIVEDTGPGMPAEIMAGPFEPFQTGADTMRHHSGDSAQEGSRGLGLGLAIVRRFVELHEGQVFIRPLPTGTQVRVILPLNPDADISSPGVTIPDNA